MTDWSTLFTIQEQLDKFIEENHNLQEDDLFDKKYLSLLVEIGELANETRCFKFWSTKPKSEKEVILEEYVDGIHFLLSLGLEKGFRYTKTDHDLKISTNLTDQFNIVFANCTQFKENPMQKYYEKLFTEYVALGVLLGFDEHAIRDAYLKKNEVNYQRQQQGY
ncbi:dUTP diphosphatase [Oceanobacillus halotolerans]|uniref:dUTP diphosphatase n=1 Tax=Oceanobacillus halotolerans TaxID=2663380 RepID=UPI0013DB04CA|nr:dUTP diphosphatase [Oceanobacillus halotolerans]